MTRATDPRVPWLSIAFGYGPMLPLVAAALGAWLLPRPWPAIALLLAISWAAVVLAFIGGVRRGFGFGQDRASTLSEVIAASVCLGLAFAALVVPRPSAALALLVVGYLFAAISDRRAALAGNAPLHFARLRPPQLALGALALAALWAWLLFGGQR